MRKKNHLPLFRDDLSTFDDFFQSTEKPIATTRLIATIEPLKRDVAFSSKPLPTTNVLTLLNLTLSLTKMRPPTPYMSTTTIGIPTRPLSLKPMSQKTQIFYQTLKRK